LKWVAPLGGRPNLFYKEVLCVGAVERGGKKRIGYGNLLENIFWGGSGGTGAANLEKTL